MSMFYAWPESADKVFLFILRGKALKNVLLQVFEMYHSGIVCGFQLKK